VATNEIE